jgi:hypothetical protein
MGIPRGLKQVPLKIIVAQAIKKIQSYGMPELQVYVDRLREANQTNDHEKVTQVLSELSTYLIQSKKKGIKVH